MARTVLLACASATLASAFAPTKTGLRSFGLGRAARAGGARGLAKMQGDEFVVGVLGDLHIDPRKMEDYEPAATAPIVEDAKKVRRLERRDSQPRRPRRVEELRAQPAGDQELFAGTLCHEMAADFLGSFGAPYEVVGGNHDLEGIDFKRTRRTSRRTSRRTTSRRRTSRARSPRRRCSSGWARPSSAMPSTRRTR